MATRTETMFASSFYTSLIKCPVTTNNLIKHFLLPRVLNDNVGTSPAPQSSGRLFKRELGGIINQETLSMQLIYVCTLAQHQR